MKDWQVTITRTCITINSAQTIIHGWNIYMKQLYLNKIDYKWGIHCDLISLKVCKHRWEIKTTVGKVQQEHRTAL